MSEQATKQTEMSKHGTFYWNELATNDLEACRKFYTELLGWKLKRNEAAGENFEYVEFGTGGEKTFGGMFQMNQQWRDAKGELPPPHWMSYIAVEDVDAAAAKVWELGGRICVPPTDIPNVGRFCVVNDPAGAKFSLITLKTA